MYIDTEHCSVFTEFEDGCFDPAIFARAIAKSMRMRSNGRVI
jgi:hypothetical protein